MCKQLQTEYPTKNKMYLYYRDPVECLKSLLRSPLLKDHLDFTPRRLFENAEKLVRVYTEWLSGDAAWSMQVCAFHIMTFLVPIILNKPCIGEAASWRNAPWYYIILR
jgi:Plavaka transposase